MIENVFFQVHTCEQFFFSLNGRTLTDLEMTVVQRGILMQTMTLKCLSGNHLYKSSLFSLLKIIKIRNWVFQPPAFH